MREGWQLGLLKGLQLGLREGLQQVALYVL